MALRLAKLFGNSPEFWLNAQRAVEPPPAATIGDILAMPGPRWIALRFSGDL